MGFLKDRLVLGTPAAVILAYNKKHITHGPLQ